MRENESAREARELGLSLFEHNELTERGRLRAALAMKMNPISRERVEREYGIDYCQRRYPEVYAELSDSPTGGQSNDPS